MNWSNVRRAVGSLLVFAGIACEPLCFAASSASPSPYVGIRLVKVERNIPYGVGLIRGGSAKQTLMLDAYLPGQNTQPGKAAMLLIHGGGFTGGDKKDYEDAGCYFAERGFVCFSINYRLMGDDPPKQISSTFEDAKTAVRWIRKHCGEYGVSPKRISAMGSSAGASIADTLALSGADEFRPDVDAPENNPTEDSRIQAAVDHSGGCAATGEADPKDAPLLIIHAVGDTTSPFQCAESLRDRMKAGGAKYEFLALPGNEHVPSLSTEFKGKTLYEHVREFLAENLTGDWTRENIVVVR